MTGSSSYQLTNEDIQYLSLLLNIIDIQNWDAFGYAILSNPSTFQEFSRAISRTAELNGMTILHACVRFNPPPHIVKMLLTQVPESPSCVDCLQRTPLHVAAGARCSIRIIKLLLEAYPQACDIQDEDGKTPLMLACDTTCELFEGDVDFVREPPSFEVVKALVRASPHSVLKEDRDGMSALEHAIFSDAPIKVVKLLQSATRKQCEAQQQKTNGMKKMMRRRSTESQDSTTTIVLKDESIPTTLVIPARFGDFSERRSVRRTSNSMAA